VTGFGFSAADDPATHQIVMFGGIDSYATTWLWDGHRWSLAHPAISPPGRFGAAMAYDPLARVVVLYGGRLGPGDVVDDTWTWDGTTWRELDNGTGSPPSGEGSAMAWDDRVSEMLLVSSNGGLGGQTWRWKGNRWVRQLGGDLPSGTIVVAMAAGPAAVTLVTLTLAGTARSATSTYTWDGTAWHSVSTGVAPADVVGMALDPVSNELLLCNDPQDPALSSTMSLWTADRWAVISGAHLPVEPGAVVTDLVDGHVLLIGFVGQPAQGAPQPVHVWAWGGASWTQRE
jgi:hypothetical protein